MNIFSILVPKHMLTYLNVKDRLDKAVDFLLASGYTAIPVINDMGEFEGIVSEGDFLRAVMIYGKDNLNSYRVSDILRRGKDECILNTADKEEIVGKILDANFVSVVDDRHCFIGIITRRSVIMTLQ